MIHDQADELRVLALRSAVAGGWPRQSAPLVVVSGGMHGVGTTTIATNLAVALARRGRRVVLVGAELRPADRDGNQQTSRALADVLAGRRHVSEALRSGPAGIQVLEGAWATEDAAEQPAAGHERLIAELKNFGPHAELIVVDAGSDRGSLARRFWQVADAALVVTTSDSASITQSYAAVKVLAHDAPPPKVHTLVNLNATGHVTAIVHARIAEACRKFLSLRVGTAGAVGRCDVARADDGALVFPPRGEWSKAMDRAVDAILSSLETSTRASTLAHGDLAAAPYHVKAA